MTDPGDATAAQPAEFSAALSQMAGLVLSRETVDTAVALVTTLAETAIAGTAGAGVTIVDEQEQRSKAASNEIVEQADALQYELDEGPCLTAWRTRQLVRVDDTGTDTRFPRWSTAVVRLGVRSVLSVPLVVDDETLGAIKVYSGQPANYDQDDERVMRLFARQAAILLANTQSLQQARRLSRQLTEALGSRDAIVRATGVLLARGAADEYAAFMELSDAARRSGLAVQTVARELLAAVVSRNARSSST